MAVEFNCESAYENPGTVCNNINDIGPVNMILLAVDGFSFASATSFATQADYITAIREKKLIPVPVKEVQAADEETTYIDTPLGDQILDRQGNYRAKYMVSLPLCVLKKLQSFRYFPGGFFKVTQRGQILGYSSDATTVKGMRIQLLNPEKVKIPPPGEYSWLPLHINEKDWKDFNNYGAIVSPSWNPDELSALVDASTEVNGNPSLTKITVDVYHVCGLNADGTPKTIPVEGLVSADFNVLTAAGVAQDTNFVESTTVPGRYIGTDTDLETGTIALVDSNSIADTNAVIDGTTQTSFTV